MGLGFACGVFSGRECCAVWEGLSFILVPPVNWADQMIDPIRRRACLLPGTAGLQGVSASIVSAHRRFRRFL